jgi:phage shock protein A
MRQNPELTEGNWERLQRYVAAHWNEQIDPDDPSRRVSFDQFVAKALSRISQLRNQAAHTHPVSRKEYSELQRVMLQSGQLACGALNALLLAWRDSM